MRNPEAPRPTERKHDSTKLNFYRLLVLAGILGILGIIVDAAYFKNIRIADAVNDRYPISSEPAPAKRHNSVIGYQISKARPPVLTNEDRQRIANEQQLAKRNELRTTYRDNLNRTMPPLYMVVTVGALCSGIVGMEGIRRNKKVENKKAK